MLKMTAYEYLKLIHECATYARIPRQPDTNGTAACRYAHALDTIIQHCEDFKIIIGEMEAHDAKSYSSKQAAA
jgi:hypothetical protein